MDHCASRIGEAYFRTPRNTVKAFVDPLAIIEQNVDALRGLCETAHLPNEFFSRHGNLSKAAREEVELRLREDSRPTTPVATTTLELGVDIGDVETVAQIGPGFPVASLRQRLGRSGRRAGKPAVLRIFAIERAADRASILSTSSTWIWSSQSPWWNAWRGAGRDGRRTPA